MRYNDFMSHAVSWFEIPVNDFERAQKFYETIFRIKLQEMNLAPLGPRL